MFYLRTGTRDSKWGAGKGGTGTLMGGLTQTRRPQRGGLTSQWCVITAAGSRELGPCSMMESISNIRRGRLYKVSKWGFEVVSWNWVQVYAHLNKYQLIVSIPTIVLNTGFVCSLHVERCIEATQWEYCEVTLTAVLQFLYKLPPSAAVLLLLAGTMQLCCITPHEAGDTLGSSHGWAAQPAWPAAGI